MRDVGPGLALPRARQPQDGFAVRAQCTERVVDEAHVGCCRRRQLESLGEKLGRRLFVSLVGERRTLCPFVVVRGLAV